METMVLPAKSLRLPKKFADMFRGKNVALTAQDDTLIIKKVNAIETLARLRGLCPGDGHEVDRFLERKRAEKEFELECDERRKVKP